MSPGWTIFGRFLGLTCTVAALILLVGYGPTRALAGDSALPAMFAGCAVSIVASLAGIVPVFRARNRPHVEAWSAAMGAMGLRLGVAIVLGIALAASGVVAAKPLLIWVVISHAGMMVPDTLLAINVLARQALAKERRVST